MTLSDLELLTPLQLMLLGGTVGALLAIGISLLMFRSRQQAQQIFRLLKPHMMR